MNLKWRPFSKPFRHGGRFIPYSTFEHSFLHLAWSPTHPGFSLLSVHEHQSPGQFVLRKACDLQEKVSAMLSTDLANQYLTLSLPSFIFLCSCPIGSDGSLLTVLMLTFAIITLSSPSFPCCRRQLTGNTGGFSLVATEPPCPLELLSKELAVNHKSAVNMFCQHSVVGKSNKKKGKIGTAFQGPEPGETFSNKDHIIGSFLLFVF